MSIERIFQILETLFNRLFKHLEFCQKYSAGMRVVFSTLVSLFRYPDEMIVNRGNRNGYETRQSCLLCDFISFLGLDLAQITIVKASIASRFARCVATATGRNNVHGRMIHLSDF